MYKIIFTILLCSACQFVSGQNIPGDKVIGEWMSEEKDSKIEIYKVGNEYFGKLLWTQDLFEADGITSRKDVRNTDEKLRTRNLLQADILKGFVFDENTWDDGKMYDPKSGKTYNCIMKLRDKLLEIRSYIGIPLFGRSTYWERQPKEQL